MQRRQLTVESGGAWVLPMADEVASRRREEKEKSFEIQPVTLIYPQGKKKTQPSDSKMPLWLTPWRNERRKNELHAGVHKERLDNTEKRKNTGDSGVQTRMKREKRLKLLANVTNAHRKGKQPAKSHALSWKYIWGRKIERQLPGSGKSGGVFELSPTS